MPRDLSALPLELPGNILSLFLAFSLAYAFLRGKTLRHLPQKVLLLALCWSIAACSPSLPSAGETIQREGEPDVYIVGREDEAMNAAIETAQASLAAFTVDLQSSYRCPDLLCRQGTLRGSRCRGGL